MLLALAAQTCKNTHCTQGLVEEEEGGGHVQACEGHTEVHTQARMHLSAHKHTHTHILMLHPSPIHSLRLLSHFLLTISLNRLHLPSLPSPLTRSAAAVRLCKR